jgi:hypothetical protein
LAGEARIEARMRQLEAHYHAHYEAATRMVSLGPPLLPLLCSDAALRFDLVVCAFVRM